MAGQEWEFQYSLIAYINEHCIFLDGQHRPMAISRQSFGRLLAIVEQFPGYFCRLSNADLPIVGGSILTHDHYQGGGPSRISYGIGSPCKDLPICWFWAGQGWIVKWPMSVLRLTSDSKRRFDQLSWQDFAGMAPVFQTLKCRFWLRLMGHASHHHTHFPAKRDGQVWVGLGLEGQSDFCRTSWWHLSSLTRMSNI